MKPVIAVPYFPGSNGDYDAISRIKEFDMIPLPLYFHIGSEQRLEESANALGQADGIVLCGGFPYEDRIGFGTIPAKIPQFRQNVLAAVQKGKPVIAFCAGNQIAHAMSLAFPDMTYRVSMLPNISPCR
jgi:phosphoribosylformylglycinamidine (FGAM) synthase-like amidotransferase family enzyme